MKRVIDVNPWRKKEEDPPEKSQYPRLNLGKTLGALIQTGNWLGWLALIFGFVLLWQILVSWSIFPSSTFPAVDGNKWQAVFLTNGQVYFGHLSEVNKEYAKLENIYYLRAAEQLQPSSDQPQANINLVKLGNEVHGPEDKIFIPKEQIVFWENMKSDSSVVQVINQLEDTN